MSITCGSDAPPRSCTGFVRRAVLRSLQPKRDLHMHVAPSERRAEAAAASASAGMSDLERAAGCSSSRHPEPAFHEIDASSPFGEAMAPPQAQARRHEVLMQHDRSDNHPERGVHRLRLFAAPRRVRGRAPEDARVRYAREPCRCERAASVLVGHPFAVPTKIPGIDHPSRPVVTSAMNRFSITTCRTSIASTCWNDPLGIANVLATHFEQTGEGARSPRTISSRAA